MCCPPRLESTVDLQLTHIFYREFSASCLDDSWGTIHGRIRMWELFWGRSSRIGVKAFAVASGRRSFRNLPDRSLDVLSNCVALLSAGGSRDERLQINNQRWIGIWYGIGD